AQELIRLNNKIHGCYRLKVKNFRLVISFVGLVLLPALSAFAVAITWITCPSATNLEAMEKFLSEYFPVKDSPNTANGTPYLSNILLFEPRVLNCKNLNYPNTLSDNEDSQKITTVSG